MLGYYPLDIHYEPSRASSSAAVSLSSINLATWSAVPRSGSIIGTRLSGSRPASNTIESQFAATTTSNSWLSLSRFYAVRLENPHPEREVVSLAMAATPHAWSSPVVLAITLDDTVQRAPPRADATRIAPQGEGR